MLLRTFYRIAPTRWGAAASLAILAAAGYLKWQSGLMPEHVAIPNPILPSPNARDLYNRAEAMLRESNLVDPIAALAPGAAPTAIDPATVAAKRQAVNLNQPALAALRHGFGAKYLQPPARSASAAFPYFKNDRTMARLLTLQGQFAARDGAWSDAVSDDTDAIQLGISLQHGTALFGSLVGIACEETGRKEAWGYIDHLTAAQAQSAVARLATLSAATVPVSRMLQEEEWFGQVVIVQLYKQARSKKSSLRTFVSDTATASDQFEFSLESPRTAYGNYTRYMDESVRRTALPWPAQIALSPQTLPADPLNRVMLPIFAGVSALQRDNIALNSLLETKLALRAYSLQHGGGYPKTLDQLVPVDLSSVPLDPFSNGRPLRYRLARNGTPLLYSIGPDAIDNDGEPVVEKEEGSKYPREGDTGDIVAGSG